MRGNVSQVFFCLNVTEVEEEVQDRNIGGEGEPVGPYLIVLWQGRGWARKYVAEIFWCRVDVVGGGVDGAVDLHHEEQPVE